MGALFDLEAEGYFCTRLQNPPWTGWPAKICALEGGHGGHAHLFRPGGQLLRHLQPSAPPGTMWCPPPPSTGNLQPLRRDHEADGHRVHLRGPRLHREEELNAAFRPNTKAVFGRPSPTPPSSSWTLKSSPRPPTPTGCPSSWTTPSPPRSTAALPVGGRHCHPLHHQVHGRPRQLRRREPSWTAASSTGPSTRQVPRPVHPR